MNEEAYWADLEPHERLYEQIKHRLSASEQRHLAELRERRAGGDERAYYGHDLLGAIGRAERRAAVAQARELLDSDYVHGNIFAAVQLLTDAAIEAGVDQEKLKRLLHPREHDDLQRRYARAERNNHK